MVAFGLLHVNIGDDIGMKKGRDNVHLLDFQVMMACESEENTECGVADGGGKDGGVVDGLHIATGNEAGIVLGDGAVTVALDLIFPRATHNAHKRGKGNEVSGVLGREGRKLLVCGEKPVVLVRAF